MASNQRSPELPDLAFFDSFQEFAQATRRHNSRSARVDRFHYERVRSRDRYFKARRIFAREPLNNRVRGLITARVEDLDIVRIGLFTQTRAAPIEHDRDVHSCPILIVSKLFD